MKIQRKKFVIRFDDLCPTMNWEIWNKVENLLNEYNIKPIIAVIPNNQDKTLVISNAKEDFWARIREYQKKGWMIALHGYNHRYTNKKSGRLGISANSEFVGLTYEEQKQKITDGIEVFNRENININAFIAPSHSFDGKTLKALKECNIYTISDGHINQPYKHKGLDWIPCQLWENYNVKKDGIYTVCNHPNFWDEKAFCNFKKGIEENYKYIINPLEIDNYKNITIYQLVRSKVISCWFKAKRIIKKLIGKK